MTKKTFFNAKCCYCDKRNKIIYIGSMDVPKENYSLNFTCNKCGEENIIWIDLWVSKKPPEKKKYEIKKNR
ncbi:hypothetical protein LCGC14_1621780 [marine sediment metagenome]|uniref:Uncharacterized protein n=1 Tax=marine sediment metagenome TaxID=412755 RepID=A0A0F9I5H4_9ZZZZ